MYYTAITVLVSAWSFHKTVRFFTDHYFQRLLQNLQRMTGIPLCVVPASLWWVLESPTLAQSDTICVLLRCHKLVPSQHKRYPWTPSCHSSFIPVELSEFENVISLERIVFAWCFWQRLVLSQHSRDWCSGFRHSINLCCCRFGHFASEAFCASQDLYHVIETSSEF